MRFINQPKYCSHFFQSDTVICLPGGIFLYIERWLASPPPNSEQDFISVFHCIIITRELGVIRKKNRIKKKGKSSQCQEGRTFAVRALKKVRSLSIWWEVGARHRDRVLTKVVQKFSWTLLCPSAKSTVWDIGENERERIQFG